MRPFKTEKAHDALRDRPADVSLLERRILILSDGKRRADDIVQLLGAQASSAVARLLQDGYLADADTAAPTIAPAPAAAVAAIERDQPIAAIAARRSIAAAKMYVVDMLQLQRGSEAAAIAAAVSACRDQDELAAHLLRALRHIHGVANASLSRRVADRLAEIMPEQYLPELGVFREALFAERTATV